MIDRYTFQLGKWYYKFMQPLQLTTVITISREEFMHRSVELVDDCEVMTLRPYGGHLFYLDAVYGKKDN